MGQLRRVLLSALPKVLLSRTTRVLTHIPLPRSLRAAVYRTYARRYGADLSEVAGELVDYRNLAAFFQRELVDGARPIDAQAPLVWPADGTLVSSGPFAAGRLPQIKDVGYSVRDLLADDRLAGELQTGSQATVYLAPGDYHRVHSPFNGEILRATHVPGGLFPVNAGSVQSIPQLFARNERVVLAYRLDDGRSAAVVLVAALNVSDTTLSCTIPGRVEKGQEIGRFGMGSTVVTLVATGEPSLPVTAPKSPVRIGAAVASN